MCGKSSPKNWTELVIQDICVVLYQFIKCLFLRWIELLLKRLMLWPQQCSNKGAKFVLMDIH